MRIATFLGSPRRNGHTATVLGWVEDELRSRGHEVDRIDVIDHRVMGCTECKGCKRGSVELCALNDDGNSLLKRMVGADAVVLAAPVFCWGFPAQIKPLVDRMYCLMDFGRDPGKAPRMRGQRMGLVATAGGVYEDNVDLMVRGFDNLVTLVECRPAGHLVVTSCTSPEALDDGVRLRAREFAGALLGA